MKKVSVLILASMAAISTVHAINITEYIEKNGPVSVKGGIVKLNNQDLTSLDGIEAIVGADTVTVLDLADNKLNAVSASQLQMFPNLLVLNLNNNNLTAFPPLHMTKLRKIKVKNNKIEMFANLDLPELKKLKANKNPVHTLSNLTLPKLRVLKLKGNKLTTISKVDMPKIKEIKVGGPASELFIQMGITASKKIK